jgi:hypothetical protein
MPLQQLLERSAVAALGKPDEIEIAYAHIFREFDAGLGPKLGSWREKSDCPARLPQHLGRAMSQSSLLALFRHIC